jgi:hypothetical protein
MDPHPNILAKTFKKGAWAFELGTEAKPGVYDVHVAGLQFFDGAGTTPIGKDFTFKVKVPGTRN